MTDSVKPNQWAPHISDPDPPGPMMTRKQSREAAEHEKQLMIQKGLLGEGGTILQLRRPEHRQASGCARNISEEFLR